MATVIYISDQWLFVQQAYWLRLLVQSFAGMVIYGFLITRFKLEAWHDVRELILMIGGPRSRLVRSLLRKSFASQIGIEMFSQTRE